MAIYRNGATWVPVTMRPTRGVRSTGSGSEGGVGLPGRAFGICGRG